MANITNDLKRLDISETTGSLTVIGWDKPTISAEGSADAPTADASGVARVQNLRGDLVLHVPHGLAVRVSRHHGPASFSGVASLHLREIIGALQVSDADELVIERDPEPSWKTWLKQAVSVQRPASIQRVQHIRAEAIYGRLELEDAEQARIDAIGGECTARNCGELALGPVGGAARISQVRGTLAMHEVGGSTDLRQIGTITQLGSIGGTLTIEDAPLAMNGSLIVGGNAMIEVVHEAGLTINAIVGGGVHTPNFNAGAGMHRIVVGNGANRLMLTVGGRLEIDEATVAA